ncbi:AAA family ATPase [Candidatus Formimonas warabiya]|uniref:AAA+ ATPase domain-containing protein n=1 Tax=Formimonas warabiya TaxID=1761012 RepID=A0A3G1KXI8_FORW1|nr:MoxR family ATPase [Candidatus Formimonas warabiya]ATW27198.1 hypothetical protein DCMF_22775 [Candidatus Formimonas warabiya]
MEGLGQLQARIQEVQNAVGKVIMGKPEAVELLLAALLSGGHVLIEDLPGTGKTTLAKALARCLDCSFQRIQFTPDLMPADVTGYNYFDQKDEIFRFREGPVISNIVLADEINRAIPRTQSSLLECMGEGQVTIDGVTRVLPRPFIVLATQNPIEQEGTFPLPEAQLDRFLFCLHIGYPSSAEEKSMLHAYSSKEPIHALRPLLTPVELEGFKKLCTQIKVEQSLQDYLIDICRATRTHKAVAVGASPRASLGFFYASRALAALRGRDYVTPDDIKYLGETVLTHRLILKPRERMGGLTGAHIVQEILETIPVPVFGEENGHAE